MLLDVFPRLLSFKIFMKTLSMIYFIKRNGEIFINHQKFYELKYGVIYDRLLFSLFR